MTLIHRSKGELTGQLRIGFLDAAVRDLLTASIQNFRQKYPNMTISLASLQVNDLSEAFNNNIVDVALCILFPNSFLPPDIIFKELYDDGISAVLPAEHQLAGQEKIYIADLLRYPLILPSAHQFPSYAQMLSEYVEHGPIPPNIICDYSHIDTALIMVEAGMGVSILPSNIENHTTSAVFRKITDCNPVLKVGAMWKKKNMSVGVPEYIDILFQNT